MTKAVFFDIDGTLINSANGITTISEKVKKEIRRLQDENNKIFIATGRPYAFLYQDILDFGFDGYILMNGSLILNKDESPFYEMPFDKNLLKELIKSFDKYNVQYILQGRKYSYIKKDFKDLRKIYTTLGISPAYFKNECDIENTEIFKIEMCCTDRQAIEFCKSLDNEDYRHIFYEECNLFELYSAKNTKASAIIRTLEDLDIDIKNSYAFGDGKNDIEMLNTVGCGIAMGNASNEIKNHADKVTLSVSEDGIAYGIKKYINNPK